MGSKSIRVKAIHHQNIENSFGSWDLTPKELKEVWDPLIERPSRKWKHLSEEDIL